MNPALDEFKTHATRVTDLLKEDLKTIRTGRANPSLLEPIIVEAYGGQTKMKLMEMATITNDDATTLTVVPYDPSTVQDIEKAIQKSPLGLNPQPQGTRMLVRIPPLSEEQRQKMVKLINQMVEEKRISLRNSRDEARKKIKQLFESKTITEDQKYRFEKEIDNESQKVMESLQKLKDRKEEELMKV